ncbi:hypothetical protein [Methanothrix sp.]|uniref:hypothetical protein n=1 Tax=Methanothrix sp. TaxID=90426 RepID=UPI0025DF44B8|nr:hypothetical protein [Methanothrix sp.]
MRLLIIGINIRHIACSAWRAGHEVYAVDGYCDLDLESCACDMAPLSRDGMEGPKGEGDPVSEHIERVRPDAIILGPGLEEVRVRGCRASTIRPIRCAGSQTSSGRPAGWRGMAFPSSGQRPLQRGWTFR